MGLSANQLSIMFRNRNALGSINIDEDKELQTIKIQVESVVDSGAGKYQKFHISVHCVVQ